MCTTDCVVIVEYNVFIVYHLSLLISVTCMVVRTPSLVYIYLSIVSKKHMNENKVFLLSFSLSLNMVSEPKEKT